MSTALNLVQNVYSLTKDSAENLESALTLCEPKLFEIKELLNLDLNLTEIMVFCWLVQFSIEDINSNTLTEVAKHLGSKKAQILDVLPIFERLQSLKLIQKNAYRNDEQPRLSEISYYVSAPMITALNSNEIYSEQVKLVKAHSSADFIRKAQKYFTDRDYCNIDQFQLEKNLIDLFKSNRQLQIVSSIEKLYANEGFTLDDTTDFKECNEVSNKYLATPIFQYAVAIKLIMNSTEGNFKFTTVDILSYVSGENYSLTYDDDYLNSDSHPLHQFSLINRLGSGGEKSEMSIYNFDNRLLNYFLADEAKGLLKLTNDSLFILPEDIKKKELYFNEELNQQLIQISKIVSREKFDKISENLKNKFKSNPGVCILLEGPPGTGKTEFVKKICSETGRALYQVDISSQKGSYLGESERLIKQLFNNYKAFCKFSEVKPIMFFNEADALFSKRLQVKQSVDQTLNAMQNIILEELENFDGILFATSNLPETFLDKAMSRRILFKVKFENPNAEIRYKIWKNIMNELDDNNCIFFANKYELSPAQIESVAKKIMFKSVLDEEINNQVIMEFCESELGNKQSQSLGFKLNRQTKILN